MARKVTKLVARKKTLVPQADTLNYNNFPAFTRSLEEEFVQMLMTNTFRNTAYVSETDLLTESAALHQQMLAKNPQFYADALVYARNSGYMRTQPIYGLAMLAVGAKEPKNSRNVKEISHSYLCRMMLEKVFNDVIKTPKDLGDFTYLVKQLGRSPGSRALSRLGGSWLRENINDYYALKYGGEKGGDSGEFSLLDMFRVYHPTELSREQVNIVRWLRGDEEVNLRKLPTVEAFERLKRARTTKGRVEAIVEGKIPHEVASNFVGSTDVEKAASWAAIAQGMPIFALLRNLATLERNGALAVPAVKDKIQRTFTSAETVQKSKIFPFRFLEAAKHVNSPMVQDALRDAVELAFDNVSDIDGNVAVMVDVSGSMHGMGGQNFIKMAAVYTAALGKKGEDVRVIPFHTAALDFKYSKRDSLLTIAEKIEKIPSGGTDCGAPVTKLRLEKDKRDVIVMITDEQENTITRGSFATEIARYRREVNPNALCFIINLAPYHKSSVSSMNDDKTYRIFGWSDQVLNFISLASRGWKSQVEMISGKSGVTSERVAAKPKRKVTAKKKVTARRKKPLL